MKSIYKFFLLLTNTCPDMFYTYYFYFITNLPYDDNYIQLKNIILSAIPKNLDILKTMNI